MGHIVLTEYLVQSLPGTPADPLQKRKPVDLPPGELPGVVYLKKELSKYRAGFELSYIVKRYALVTGDVKAKKKRTSEAVELA